MRGAGIVGIGGVGGRATWKYTKPDRISSDLARREFARQRPNELWVTDTTRWHPRTRGSTHPRGQGVLRCRPRHLFAPDRGLVDRLLAVSRVGDERPGRAIDSRARPGAETGTIIYSDHGAQFASWAFTKQVEDAGLLPLWSRPLYLKSMGAPLRFGGLRPLMSKREWRHGWQDFRSGRRRNDHVGVRPRPRRDECVGRGCRRRLPLSRPR